MAVAHTPGPWILDAANEGRVFERRVGIYSEGRACIVDVPTWAPASEEEANARLIAAAPDLLQALRDLRDAATDAYKSGRIAAEPFLCAGNVLAKAEGR